MIQTHPPGGVEPSIFEQNSGKVLHVVLSHEATGVIISGIFIIFTGS